MAGECVDLALRALSFVRVLQASRLQQIHVVTWFEGFWGLGRVVGELRGLNLGLDFGPFLFWAFALLGGLVAADAAEDMQRAPVSAVHLGSHLP